MALHLMQGGDGLDPYAELVIPKNQTITSKKFKIANLLDATFSEFDPAILQTIATVYRGLADRHIVKTISFDFEEGFSIAKQLFQADAGLGLQQLLNKLDTKKYSPQLNA